MSFENSEDFSLDSLFLDQDSSNESPNHMNQTPELNIPHHPESNFVSENPLQEMIPFDWTSTNPWGHQGCGKKQAFLHFVPNFYEFSKFIYYKEPACCDPKSMREMD